MEVRQLICGSLLKRIQEDFSAFFSSEIDANKARVPMLFLSGRLDSWTPLSSFESDSRRFTEAQYVESPCLGQSFITEGKNCAWSIMSSFLADPTKRIDTSYPSNFCSQFLH
ncbi:alpha/beta hydrolase [Pajaroellobacter abortibovis]